MRRIRRSRALEIEAHVVVARAAAELCTALMASEPQVPDFMFARKVILDGIALLEQEQKAAVTPPPAETKA